MTTRILIEVTDPEHQTRIVEQTEVEDRIMADDRPRMEQWSNGTPDEAFSKAIERAYAGSGLSRPEPTPEMARMHMNPQERACAAVARALYGEAYRILQSPEQSIVRNVAQAILAEFNIRQG